MEKACIKFIYLHAFVFLFILKKVKFLYGLMYIYRYTLYSYLKDRLNVCDDLARPFSQNSIGSIPHYYQHFKNSF